MEINEKHTADVLALTIAIQVLFKHLPKAREEMQSRQAEFLDGALAQPLTDAQLERLKRALSLYAPMV